MLSLVAFNLVHDVMHQQFQTQALHRVAAAPKLQWRLSASSWTHPIAAALRSAADALEGADQRAYSSLRAN